MAAATRSETAAIECHKQDSAAPELVRVGFVSGAHGLRGAMRVRMDNPDSDILLNLRSLVLTREGASSEYGVASAQRVGRGTLRIVLEGIGSVDAAESLRGSVVLVNATQLPATGPGEFYYFQAVGCEVVTTAGRRVGIIEQVLSTGANEVWVVRNGAMEYLVPVIEDVVKVADWAGRRVTVEPVPGLLD